ncbi:MAG: dockerin [Chitinivibrionales bacterium]|nr:dockerin [Chitinivibrionales bacterium]
MYLTRASGICIPARRGEIMNTRHFDVWQLAILLISMIQPSGAEIIPASRRIEWDPGIPGGIPHYAATVNVMDFGAEADGTTDDHDAFAAAIASLPSRGGVVFIPAGTYNIGSTINLSSGIILRGAGSDKTKLLFSMANSSPCIEAVTYQRGDWKDVASGFDKGSRELVLSDASEFSVGDFVEIQQDNDASLMYTQSTWNVSWAENSVGQILVVESIAGNTLTVDKPLYHSYSASLNPQIRTQGFVTHAGVEKLFVKKTVNSADGGTFHFKNAAYCWVREVESDHTRKSHIATSTAYRCEFRHNYFHHAWDHGGGGHGYGVNLGLHTTDCLVEDNIFRHLRHAMLVQVGACGNVFGYNYSIENVQGAGETNLNQGWTPCDISLHGHYPNYNLFESNSVQEIDVADYWGPCGPGNTFLRNVVESEGIDVLDHSHTQNVVGNMLGDGENDLTIENNVQHSLVHGNSAGGSVEWDASISDQTIPPTYYLTQKPDFFGDTPWPVLGWDVTAAFHLPAIARYVSGEYTPISYPSPGKEFRQSNVRIAQSGRRLTLTIEDDHLSGAVVAIHNAQGSVFKTVSLGAHGGDATSIYISMSDAPAASGIIFVTLRRHNRGSVTRFFAPTE